MARERPDFKPQAIDEAMLWYGIDRNNRAATGDARVPRGAYANVNDALSAFRQPRAEMMQSARTTEEDLRGANTSPRARISISDA